MADNQHPELHAKELAEMRRLVNVMSDGSADVVGRAAIRCLWCSEVVAVPPYRPHSFFFKGSSEEPEGEPPSCCASPSLARLWRALQEGLGGE